MPIPVEYVMQQEIDTMNVGTKISKTLKFVKS